MIKCDKCQHKGVCKYEENMNKFEKEIREKQKLLEYQMFGCEINCKHFIEIESRLRGTY